LVRGHSRRLKLARIAQSCRDQARQCLLFEHAVPRERVQVHARGLPRSVLRDARPILLGERQRRQQHERKVRNVQRSPALTLNCITSSGNALAS